MSSKLNKVGWLLIDHRDSPGLPDEMVHRAGMPSGAGRGVFQADTFTCVHCCRVVLMNPLRTRDRAWCAKCDRYICDACGAAMAASGVCKPFAQVVEEIQEAASKSQH
jgi:hypothetical protein